MSPATRQLIEVLAALAPYVLFAALIVWSMVADVLDDFRNRRARRPAARD
jgi:hypothetical protein